MNIAEASIKYRTITWVMTVLIIGGGYFAYEKLGRLEDPEFTIKNAQVFTFYPGASAMEVAEEVTDPLERAVQNMGQLKEVTSISEPGKSTILVEMKDKYDKDGLPQVWDELRRKVNDAQSELPPGTQTSIVYDDFGDVYGIFFAVYGDGFTDAELHDYAKLLRRELLLVRDVGKVDLFAVQDEVINVEIRRERMAEIGVSPDAIYQTLSGQNLVVPAGNARVGDLYLRIEPTGEIKTVEDIGNLRIIQPGSSSRLYLRDIAHITRDYKDPPARIMRFGGRQAVGIGISTVEGGNVVVMGNAVENRLRELMATEIPIGVELGPIAVQNQAVTTAINGFVVSLLQAVAIVVGILMFAMGLRSGILIGVILLLTVLATFIFMWLQGIVLERISLGALIIALGMLVDNAIVVVEGILVGMEKGEKPVKAASNIVKQTMWPLFGATMVAILAFAAIGVSQDSTGEYCRSLFQVILISLLMSWVLAITLTPFFGVMFLKPPTKKEGEENRDPYGGILFRLYRAFLEFCLRSRVLTIVVLLGMLALSLYGFGFVSKSFFPASTRPQFMVHYWLPQGTHIQRTDADLNAVAEYVQKTFDGEGEVTDVSAFAGGGAMRFLLTYTPEDVNSGYGLLLVSVDDWTKIDGIAAQIDEDLEKKFPDAMAYSQKFMLGPGDAMKIQIRLRGPDPEILRRMAEVVKQVMDESGNAIGIQDDWRQRVPVVKPIIAETQARNLGLTRREISVALARSFDGVNVGVFREGDELLPILIRSPDAERLDIASIDSVRIWSPIAQQFIPIRQVVTDFETTTENAIIRRRYRVPTVTIKCNPKEGEATTLLADIWPKLESRFNDYLAENPGLKGYTLERGGEFENSRDAQAALFSKLPIVGLLMVLVVIFLFNGLREPACIFLTVPLALIGVTLGLLVMDQPFGFMALLGFMSLTGMLIKNAIVLIDEIRTQRAAGVEDYTAVVMSGVSRVRPVSMAALTTVLGMVPLLADAFFVSMAVTIMFGLTFATVLTLIFVPVLYAMFFGITPQKG